MAANVPVQFSVTPQLKSFSFLFTPVLGVNTQRMANIKTIVPWAVSKVKTQGWNGEVMKRNSVLHASQSCAHKAKSEQDCKWHGVCDRSKGFLTLLCIPQTLSIMHFPPLPSEHRGQDAQAHTCTHPKAYSDAWHLNTLSGEEFMSKDEYRLTATSGRVKVT